MGQRLVLKIMDGTIPLCTMYYHWSAYTLQALEQIGTVVSWLEEEPDSDIRLMLLRRAEAEGGGIDGGRDSNEFKRIQEMYPGESFKENDISQNDGLVDFTGEGMADSERWAESLCTIDIAARLIYFDTLFLSSMTGYTEEEGTQHLIDNMPVLDIDPTEIPFDMITEVIEELGRIEGNEFRCVIDDEEMICQMIR